MLRQYVGGASELEFEVDSYRELLRALDQRFPGFAELVEGRMTVALDGELISDPMFERLEVDSEVHFVPRISGG